MRSALPIASFCFFLVVAPTVDAGTSLDATNPNKKCGECDAGYKCEEHVREHCEMKETPVCRIVPREVCSTVEQPSCHTVANEECRDETVQVCDEVAPCAESTQERCQTDSEDVCVDKRCKNPSKNQCWKAKKTCRDNPTQTCKPVAESDCEAVRECREVTEPRCETVHKEQCVTTSKSVCRIIEEEDCEIEQEPECVGTIVFQCTPKG